MDYLLLKKQIFFIIILIIILILISFPMHKIQTIELEGIIYNAGFRVVTQDMKSLGLRKNPNIIQYPINEWLFLPEEELQEGISDWGGIWVARTFSGAKGISKYMKKKYDVNTKIFSSAIEDILYVNSYRIKTNGIYLVNEINFS